MEKVLRFKEDGTLKVMQFTDIHFTMDDERDARTVALMRKLIGEEKPDFLIATGDTVYGEENLVFLEKALAPFVESKIPWSFAFGNHDVEFNSNHAELFQKLLTLPGCMAFDEAPGVSGTGNHTIPVLDKDGKLRWVIAALDSGDYNPLKKVGGYAYLPADQIAWYKERMKEYEKQEKDFSALTFMHMAIMEFYELWWFETCYGEKNEEVGCPKINSGFFAAMQEEGHTKGLFVGHDHINDYYGKLYGITLGYGRGSGFGTYGKEGFQRGARIFTLREDNLDDFETYIRLEDGAVIHNQAEHKPEMIREGD